MAAVLENTVGRWLRKMDIFVAGSLLREKILAHPDYPSLLAVTDTLDELGIDNAALQIEKERLYETPLPFLAHDAAHGDFVVIDNISKQVKAAPAFENNWNGTDLLSTTVAGVQITPTILIDGWKLSKQYLANDLKGYYGSLIKTEQEA